MTCLRKQLDPTVSASSVDVEFKLTSVYADLTTPNDTIGKLRTKVKTGCDPINYNLRRACAQNSGAIDACIKAGSDRRREVFT